MDADIQDQILRYIKRTAESVEVHHRTFMGLPFWQFIGIVIILSLLVGAPVFACIVFHKRRARDVQTKVVRSISGTKAPNDYELYHKHHSGAHYYDETADQPSQPRRTTSSSSNFPLLRLSPEKSRNPSRNVSPSQHRHIQNKDANLNANFAERTGAATSMAYPQTIPRVPGRKHGYGTLGNIVGNTYTAAQRAYRGRHRLNFLPAWMNPWSRKGELEPIDEEHVGSARLSKTQRNKKHARKKNDSSQSNILTIPTNVSISGATRGTVSTTASGFSMRGTPPAFPKIDEQAGYNPQMARSLTRRLIQYGFAPKDGVEPNGTKTAPVRITSGPWKGRADLKKRAIERRRLESGNGLRLFSMQKNKMPSSPEEDMSDEDPVEVDQQVEQNPQEDSDRTSIRDFAHAFHQDISLNGNEEVSMTGTIRRLKIEDEEDRVVSPDSENSEISTGSASTAADVPSAIQDKNPTDCEPNNDKENIQTPTQTLRGRRTSRDKRDTPVTQRKRMERNTPKNTAPRNVSVSQQMDDDDEAHGDTDKNVESGENEFVDITKEVLGYSPQKQKN